MDHKTSFAIRRNDELLKEEHPLATRTHQIASWPDVRPRSEGSPAEILDLASLENAMLGFCANLLFPVELPTIYKSFLAAQENDFQTVSALDLELVKRITDSEFASASEKIGRSQLKRLRPLKDHRLTQKYLVSMEHGETHGWHTIVYGISLEIYSIPVRQGMMNYADRTLSSLIDRAAEKIGLEESRSSQILDRLIQKVPKVIDGLIPDFSDSMIKII